MAKKPKMNRMLTVYYLYQNNKPVPIIRLQGKWLRKLGFEPGNKIRVAAKRGRLLIKLIPQAEQ